MSAIQTDDGLSAFGELALFQDYPGFHNAAAFLKRQISVRGAKVVADLGGGANPMLDETFIAEQGVKYSVLDISPSELAKAPPYPLKMCLDICAETESFVRSVGDYRADLVFSHMFLEHIDKPAAAHRNIHAILRPGGVAVHFYPSPNNIPLTINRLAPEWISDFFLSLAQPGRKRSSNIAKFPAYYKLCGMGHKSVCQYYEKLGFTVLCHSGFIGHDYYKRFVGLRDLELTLRRLWLALGLRHTSAELLVLRKN